MKEWKPILLGARSSLIYLVLIAILCIGTIVQLNTLSVSLDLQVQDLGRTVQVQRSEIAVKKVNLRNMRSNIEQFETLRAQNLIGTPVRLMWVDELLAAHSRLGIPTRLVYQLQQPKTLASTQTPVTPNATTPSITPSPVVTGDEPLVHDLQFELHDVHESDVLRMIQDFRSHVKGRFRVNACTFSEPRALGMTAKCVLRFVTIPQPHIIQPAKAALQNPTY